MERIRFLAARKRLVNVIACALPVLVVLCIPFTQQTVLKGKDTAYSSQPSTVFGKHSIPKLKICNPHTSGSTLFNDSVEIPTFFTNGLTYMLEKYEITRDSKVCPTGEEPVSPHVTIVAKADYDEEMEVPDVMFILELLRSIPILLDNGYLSVGVGTDDNRKTAHYYSPEEFCVEAVHGSGIRTTVDFKICPVPKSRPKLSKCCPLGMVLSNGTCVGQTSGSKWEPEYMDAKTWKIIPFAEANPVYVSPLLPCEPEYLELWQADNCTFEFHPVTDNTVAFIGAYRNWEFLDSKVDWCMDALIENGTEYSVMFHCAVNQTNSESDARNQARISLLYLVTMYIGAFFHLMTTSVYLITWTKQNIHGKTLCSCTASLLLMQVFLGTAHLLGRMKNRRKTIICIGNGIGAQYFMIAAFTWLLVLNYDLWRTFRSMRAEGGKSLKRFLVYSCFGWIFPFIVTTISVGLDFTFECRASRVLVPEFGDYYCFVAPWAQGFYVYYILGILIAFVVVLAVLTLTSLYNFKKDTANLRTTRRADEKQNVLLFLKLTVVMGLTWTFEVISWAATKENENHVAWIILDLYNALSAILIFLIFVCKRTTLNLLEQSIPQLKGITAALSKLSSTFSGDSSFDNTASTSANGSSQKKSSIDSPAVVAVRYTKEKELDSGGNTNVAFEQTTFK